jgi:hypothetical protein
MCQQCESKCEGIPLSSNCIIWEGKKYDFSSFNALVEFAVDTSKDYMAKPVVDLKTLSKEELNRDQILQLFVDKIIQLQLNNNTSSSNNSFNCNLDISSVNNCGSCAQSFCEKLQILVNTVATLQAEINQLKQTVYN